MTDQNPDEVERVCTHGILVTGSRQERCQWCQESPGDKS